MPLSWRSCVWASTRGDRPPAISSGFRAFSQCLAQRHLRSCRIHQRPLRWMRRVPRRLTVPSVRPAAAAAAIAARTGGRGPGRRHSRPPRPPLSESSYSRGQLALGAVDVHKVNNHLLPVHALARDFSRCSAPFCAPCGAWPRAAGLLLLADDLELLWIHDFPDPVRFTHVRIIAGLLLLPPCNEERYKPLCRVPSLMRETGRAARRRPPPRRRRGRRERLASVSRDIPAPPATGEAACQCRGEAPELVPSPLRACKMRCALAWRAGLLDGDQLTLKRSRNMNQQRMEGMRDRSSRYWLVGGGFVFYTLVVFTLVFGTRLDTRLIALWLVLRLLVRELPVADDHHGRRHCRASGAAPRYLTPAQDCTSRHDRKTVIVTGANSGCGKETARLLFLSGSWLVATRTRQKGPPTNSTTSAWAKKGAGCGGVPGPGELRLHSSLCAAARGCRARTRAALACGERSRNNAGVRTDSLYVTADQIERHFQVNHLGHYLLTRLLLDALAAGAALSKTTSRVVHVASSAHAWGAVPAEVYGVQVRNTDPVLFGARMASNIEGVYGDTKLMQVLFSAELQRRLRHLPIQSIAVHPGFVATRFGATDRRWLQTLLVVTRPFLARDPQQGALTQVLAATSPNLPRRAGLYLDNCTIQTPAPQARDAPAAWLWT